MSRSWRERVSVFLGADAVELTRRTRWRQRVVARHRAPYDGAGWQAALAALENALAAVRWPAADAEVVVSNQFVRFAQVPQPGRLRNESERLAAARHTLRHVFGQSAEQWNIALAETARGGSGIAAGIEREFMAGVVAKLKAASMKAVGIEPLMARAFNLCRPVIGGKPAWLAVAEPGRIALAFVERGRWYALRNLRLRGELADELPMLLDQARVGEGVGGATGRVVLASTRLVTGSPVLSGDWSLEPVLFDGVAAGAATNGG